MVVIAKWRFDREGTWAYPSLHFTATTGDVLDADFAPDKWWTSVDPATPATITVIPDLGPFEGTPDGAFLIYDAAAKRFVPGQVGVFDEYGRVTEAGLPARLSDAAIQEKIDANPSVLPATVAPESVAFDAAEGTSVEYARADHAHGISITPLTDTDVPSAYPLGISGFSVSGGNWPGDAFGQVLTVRFGDQRTTQTFYDKSGGSWMRTESAHDVWGAWLAGGGDVTQADLDAATAPLQSSIDGLTAQQDQLMATAATVDEISGSIKTDGIWPTTAAIVCLQDSTHSNIVHSLWVAPFPCKLTSFNLVREYGSTPASDTNYISVELRRKVPNGALNVIATKTTKVTGGEAMTSRVPWNFDGASWDDTAATFAVGDFISVEATVVGSEELRYPVTFTFAVQPL